MYKTNSFNSLHLIKGLLIGHQEGNLTYKEDCESLTFGRDHHTFDLN